MGEAVHVLRYPDDHPESNATLRKFVEVRHALLIIVDALFVTCTTLTALFRY